MSTENREAREVARHHADGGKAGGIPTPIWVALIGAATTIFGTIYGHESGKATPPDNQFNLNRVSGEIRHPSPGDLVGNAKGEFECSGMVAGLTPGLHLWLAVERNGYIWPKEDHLDPDGSGNWKKTITEQGDPKEPFTVTLFVANDEAHKVIGEWFRIGKESNNFARLEWIRGINRLDRVDRLRPSPRL